MSLYHRIQKLKDNPDTERAGAYWSPEEDTRLLESINSNKALTEISFDHKRTSGSIEIRIRSLAYRHYCLTCKEDVDVDRTYVIKITSEKFRIPFDELSIYIRDKEKYTNAKEEERLVKKTQREAEQAKIEEAKEEERLAKKAKREEVLALQVAKETEKLTLKAIKEEERLALKTAKETERLAKLEDAKELQQELEMAEKSYNYIYCIREREFLKSGENIFKVGKTSVHPFKRMKQYPNGSEIVLIIKVDNCHETEKKLLQYLDERYKTAVYDGKRIGREYYSASEDEIVKSITKLITS